MLDDRLDTIDLALADLPPDDTVRADLWAWACREMLHETQTGMHQLSCVAGIAEHVAEDWLAPVDVIEPAQPYLKRAVFADRRLGEVLDGLDGEGDPQGRARLWRLRYATLIAATVQGMQALAGKYRIQARFPHGG